MAGLNSLSSSDSELKRPGDTQNTTGGKLTEGRHRSGGLPDTQAALPSQRGSTTPASGLLCGLQHGQGRVGQHGTGPPRARAAPFTPHPHGDPERRHGERGHPGRLLPLTSAASPPSAAFTASPPAPGAPATGGSYPLSTTGEQRIETGSRGVATVALSKLRQT